MNTAVVLETYSHIPDAIRQKLLQHNIPVKKAVSVEEYSGNENFILEYTAELSSDELDTFICHACGLPAIIGYTDRLIIREIGTSDYNVLVEMYQDFPEAFTEDFPLIMSPFSHNSEHSVDNSVFFKDDEFAANLHSYICYQYCFYGYGLWILERKSDNRIIGLGGLYGHEQIYISYGILSPFRNNGYGSEAIGFITDYANNILKIHDITAVISDTNSASIALADKFGIKKDISRH